MRSALALLAAVFVALASAPAAHAQDSDAPPGALPHWIPEERWVYEHWLPYDETRLYRVLGVDRGRIWRHLRDDAEHELAELGRARGLSPQELAGRLVAPRRGRVRPATFRLLRSRALRTVTQGHLSQHILFHSLHQRTLVYGARRIFGVPTRRFVDLRVEELSPIEIGRLHGRSAVGVRRRAVAALRATARRGVRSGVVTAAQARRLLTRQLRQLPRWLGQRRYNGPPRATPIGTPVLPVADWANHPTISADGSRVAFDAYRATIPDARRLGEIRVVVADLLRGKLLEASHASGVRAGRPRSGYHSALSADGGSVVFEVAEGNMNYAKRYGQMRVALHDTRAGRTLRVSHPQGRRGPARTAYNPTVSGDGRLVAFEAAGALGGGASAVGLWLVDRRTGREQLVGRGSSGATYEPRLSADGRVLAFSAADAGTDGRALVFVRDVASGETTLVSRAPGPGGASADDDAYEPAISADGRFVAFTSAAGNLGRPGRRSRIWVRDLANGTVESLGGDTGAFAFDPSISADGRFVAFASRPAGRGRRPALRRARVWVHDRGTGRTVLVSRRDGPAGVPAGGFSSEPSVSEDGARVAFTSTAADLDRRKPAGLTGVFVRDLRAGTTRLLSTHAPRTVPPLPGTRARASAARSYLCFPHA